MTPGEGRGRALDGRGALLEQYKLYVEMADRISARRGLTNSYFLTLNTGIVALVGALKKFPTGTEAWWRSPSSRCLANVSPGSILYAATGCRTVRNTGSWVPSRNAYPPRPSGAPNGGSLVRDETEHGTGRFLTSSNGSRCYSRSHTLADSLRLFLPKTAPRTAEIAGCVHAARWLDGLKGRRGWRAGLSAHGFGASRVCLGKARCSGCRAGSTPFTAAAPGSRWAASSTRRR